MTEGRAGSLTVWRLADEMNAKIMRAMVGGFEALTLETKEPRPPAVEEDDDEPKYVITSRGRESLPVASALEYWLLKAPGGGLRYEEKRSKRSIEALARAWGLAVMHAFAYGPHTATQLAGALEGLERPGIERLLKSMHKADLLEAGEPVDGKEVSYVPTEWLRRAIGPIAMAARIERSDPPDGAAPIDSLDVEAALLLSVPLVHLPDELSGACRLACQIGRGQLAGVTATVNGGQIVELASGTEHEASAEVSGDIRAWFRALIDARPHRLDFSGDRPLARAVVERLGDALFGGG